MRIDELTSRALGKLMPVSMTRSAIDEGGMRFMGQRPDTSIDLLRCIAAPAMGRQERTL